MLPFYELSQFYRYRQQFVISKLILQILHVRGLNKCCIHFFFNRALFLRVLERSQTSLI
jgi:hypothetical protein